MAVLLVGATVWVAFGWTLSSYFLGDDFGYVSRFQALSIRSWPGLFVREWSEGMWGFELRELRPIAALAFILDAHIWGANPFGYYVTNLGLHGLNSLLVMLITRISLDNRWIPAAGAAVLFALHPVHAQTVNWITGRIDMLAALGYLSGFLAFLLFRAQRTTRWLIVSWVAFAVGVFTKEFCLTLPVVAVAYDRCCWRSRERASGRGRVSPYVGWFVIAVIYFVCRTIALGASLGAPELNIASVRFWTYVAQRQLQYVGMLLPPLAGLPDRTATNETLAVVIWVLGCLVLLGVTVYLLKRGRDHGVAPRPVVFFGVIWLFVTTAPFVVTYLSGRHLYLAVAGLSIAATAVVSRLFASTRYATAIALCVIAALSGWSLGAASEAWREAGRLSRLTAEAVAAVASRASTGEVLLLDVPARHRQAWAWSFATPFSLRPPFQKRNVAQDLVVVERPDVYFYPEHWEDNPAIARVRTYSGNVWLVTSKNGMSASTVLIRSERLEAARQKGALDLHDEADFTRLVAILTEAEP